MNYLILSMGLILGLMFVGVMIFQILPRLDHIVKKEYGPAEAYFTTRFCCLCIGLPFYVFTIWMTTVILFDEAKGISVLQEICLDDYSCASTFAMGRENFDKSACQSADCGEANLLARAGAQPLNFPRLGLGKSFEPVESSVTFQCELRNITTGVCEEILETEGGAGDTCVCVKNIEFEGKTICGNYVGCNDDIPSVTQSLTCTSLEGDACTDWDVTTDSAKQFSFQSCSCSEGIADCDVFTCDIFTMEYNYPNVFYAGAATILFILPLMIATYSVVKTQMGKLIKCNEMKMYVYSQEAGVQEEYVAEDLVTGGFNEKQEQKEKARTCSRYDVGMMIAGPAIITFFSFMVVMAAGRVGMAFIGLAAGIIVLAEILSLRKKLSKQSDNLKERLEKNNPDLGRGY